MAVQEYLLRYDGPADQSENTLRHIKGVFIADLEFPISDVQRFLTSAPITILQAQQEEKLQHAFELLQHAGAKVSIQLELTEEIPLESTPAADVHQNEVSADTIEVLSLDPIDTSTPSFSPQTTQTSATEFENTLEIDLDSEPEEVSVASQVESHIKSSPSPISVATPVAPQPSKILEPLNISSLEFSLDTSDDKEEPVQSTAAGQASPPPVELSLSFEEEKPEAPVETPPVAPKNVVSATVTPALAPPIAKPAVTQVMERPKVVTKITQPLAMSASTGEGESPSENGAKTNEVAAPAKEISTFIPPVDRLAPLPEPRKIASKSKFNPKTVIAATILVSAFIALNAFYLVPSLEKGNIKQTFDLQEIFNQDNAAKTIPTIVPTDRFSFTADQSFNNFRITSETNQFIDLPAKISFTITLPDPAPLTKEEIVAGKKAPDSLRRVEIKNIPLILDTNQKLQAAGFLQVAGEPVRIAVPLLLRAGVSKDNSMLSLTIISDREGAPPESGITLQKQEVSNTNIVLVNVSIQMKKILTN